MTSKLALYNDALLACKERFLASLTEEREPRRLLDQVWASGGVNNCLEQAQWHFAMRTIQIDYDPSIEPSFGYRRAFQKPTDWVVTSAVCTDEYFRVPLTQYTDEAGYWYSDLETIYVKYVSNDDQYGNNLGAWPESFTEFVAAHFASRIVGKLSGGESREQDLLNKRERRLEIAKNKAAMAEPTSFPARGSWSNSRNRFPARRDGGNRGSLIG